MGRKNVGHESFGKHGAGSLDFYFKGQAQEMKRIKVIMIFYCHIHGQI
jgi:hypothetical protein